MAKGRVEGYVAPYCMKVPWETFIFHIAAARGNDVVRAPIAVDCSVTIRSVARGRERAKVMPGCYKVCQVTPGKHVCDILVKNILVHVSSNDDTIACQYPLLESFLQVLHECLSRGSCVVVVIEVLDVLGVYGEFSASVVVRVSYGTISADYPKVMPILSLIACRGPSAKACRVVFYTTVKAGNLIPC
jgi:hypothetical protein